MCIAHSFGDTTARSNPRQVSPPFNGSDRSSPMKISPVYPQTLISLVQTPARNASPSSLLRKTRISRSRYFSSRVSTFGRLSVL